MNLQTNQAPLDELDALIGAALDTAFGEPDRVVGDFLIVPVAALFRHVLALTDGNPEPPPAPPAWLAGMLRVRLELSDAPDERGKLREVAVWAAGFLRERALQALADVGLPAMPGAFGVYHLPSKPPLGFSGWLEVRALASGSAVFFVRPPSAPRVVLDEYHGAAAALRRRREVRP